MRQIQSSLWSFDRETSAPRCPHEPGLLLLQLRAPEAILPPRNACRRGGESPSSPDQNSNAGTCCSIRLNWLSRDPRTDAQAIPGEKGMTQRLEHARILMYSHDTF